MRTRVLTAIFLIAGVLLALFTFPFYLFLVLIDIALVLGHGEMKKITGNTEAALSAVTLVFLVLLPWVWNYSPELIGPVLAAALILHIFAVILNSPPDLKLCITQVSSSFFSLIYLGVPLSILSTFQINSPLSAGDDKRIRELMLVFIVLWLSDSAAYFAGRAFGRHKITPRISPNKSLEGFIAGTVVPPIAALIYGIYLLPQFPAWFLILAGLILGICGIMGDLFESALKRGAGIKDSSGLFPGHGGLLDRLDSILAGIPAYFLLKLLWEWPW